MPATKLGAYILDHDEKSFLIQGKRLQKIEYENDTIQVNGEEKNELLDRTHKDYIDYKFSFEELNFDEKKEAVEKLEMVAADIAQIEIENPHRQTWGKNFRVDKSFDKLSASQKKAKIQELVNNKYSEKITIRDWKRDQDGWGKEIVRVKLQKTYKQTEKLNDSIISIHTKSRDEALHGQSNYNVKPHLHITLDKNKRFGKNFCYLRKEINNVLKKHNITASHNLEVKQKNKDYNEYRILKDRLSAFSWVLNKHDDSRLIRQQLNSYRRNDKCVRLDNIENKINRYLELDGSYDFARKIQINLKEKLNTEIKIKKPKEYIKAENQIKNEEYEKIINTVRKKAITSQKISEKYKEFTKETLKNDNVDIKKAITAQTIKEVVKNRGYYYDQNFKKQMNKKRINQVCNKQIEKLKQIKKQQILKNIKERKYISQKNLRKDLKIANIEDIKEIADTSQAAIIFQGLEKHISNKLPRETLLEIESPDDIKEKVTELEKNNSDLTISENWKDKLSQKIYDKYFKENKIDKVNKLKNKNKNIRNKVSQIQQILKLLNTKMENALGFGSEDITGELDRDLNKFKKITKVFLQAGLAQNKKNVINEIEKDTQKYKNWEEHLTKQLDELKEIKTVAAENGFTIKDIKKVDNGYKVKAQYKKENHLQKIKFRSKESEEAFKYTKMKLMLIDKEAAVEQQIKQLSGGRNLNSMQQNKRRLQKQLEELNRKKGKTGILAKLSLTGGDSRSEIAQKIAIKEKNLKELEEKIQKTKNLQKERSEIINKIELVRDHLRETESKVTDKVRHIEREHERGL